MPLKVPFPFWRAGGGGAWSKNSPPSLMPHIHRIWSKFAKCFCRNFPWKCCWQIFLAKFTQISFSGSFATNAFIFLSPWKAHLHHMVESTIEIITYNLLRVTHRYTLGFEPYRTISEKPTKNNQWWITHERMLRVFLGYPKYLNNRNFLLANTGKTDSCKY